MEHSALPRGDISLHNPKQFGSAICEIIDSSTQTTALTAGLAMLISVDVRIPFHRSLVYATYRDHLLDVVPYLENVRAIEVKSRQAENGRVSLVNEWHGGGEIPAAARAILSDAMLSWTDVALWDETAFSTDWQITTHAFTEAVRCGGTNRFLEDGTGTLIESRGKMTIDPKQIHGVPHFLAGAIAGVVEDYLGKKIAPNLQQTGEAVRRYLERQG